MGQTFADKYSVLHFATGIAAFFWGFSKIIFAGLHISFEILENTEWGMNLINRLPFWPGGKTHADSVVNMLGDTVFAVLGFVLAEYAGWWIPGLVFFGVPVALGLLLLLILLVIP